MNRTISQHQRMAIRSTTARRKYASDAELKAARQEQQQERDRIARAERAARGLDRHYVREEPPPSYVLAERDRAGQAPASPFGDPPPGRSALDRKRGIAR